MVLQAQETAGLNDDENETCINASGPYLLWIVIVIFLNFHITVANGSPANRYAALEILKELSGGCVFSPETTNVRSAN